ncbi:BlaR1 peptidase M56 [Paenibacillus sp. 32O-W]|uniref:M56 family metallopeptidase n=1 Tax=Paenibacillus sp. 32O-W TaxID=1695218 RepID=UPI00071EF07E|nr:M56 family metallopeptidase [Paenibacillus sp. 32O-W]ALS28877.1 BlaR1 peptidase M56 [Paenibacillus sp. 32O-W]
MKPETKVKWVYAVMLLFGFLMLLQMGMYVAHQIWNIPLRWNIIQYCVTAIGEKSSGHVWVKLVFNLVIVYTVGKIAWRIGKQWVLTRKWLCRFREAQHQKLTKRLNKKYRHWNTEFIVIEDHAFLALALGVWKPKIIVSSALFDLFDEREVRAILLHEWYHCRNRDNLKFFLSTLMVDAFGYLPIVKSTAQYYQTWKELLADRFAVKQMGTEIDLGNVLLTLANHKKMVQYRAAGVYFANTAINYRIQQLLEPQKTVEVPLTLYRPLFLSSLTLFLMSSLLFGGCS